MIYVHDGLHYVEVECTTAFCFAAVRKLLFTAWKIDDTGPQYDKEEGEGSLNRPLDIRSLNVPL